MSKVQPHTWLRGCKSFQFNVSELVIGRDLQNRSSAASHCCGLPTSWPNTRTTGCIYPGTLIVTWKKSPFSGSGVPVSWLGKIQRHHPRTRPVCPVSCGILCLKMTDDVPICIDTQVKQGCVGTGITIGMCFQERHHSQLQPCVAASAARW